ncbi:MAG: hypothetical protein QOG15_725 [Solirubrobacteraceae bacterium]|nr:hypothetical protein [Solirubrobacteraceae bacterium]
MDLRAIAKAALPPLAQDLLRRLVDQTLPRRRRALANSSAHRIERNLLAAKISPDGVVLAGPFEGLRLSRETSWGSAAPYLLGTYEQELQPWIEMALETRPSVVVDIGAAEGYYAVGLARLLPDAVIYAFDIDPQAQRASRCTARLNGVTNVRVRGRIDTSALQRVLVPGSLVISDCEGFERQVLDPDLVPALRNALVIVELHDFLDSSISTIITSRFERTHAVQMIDQIKRPRAKASQLGHLTPSEWVTAVDEDRPDSSSMQWAVLIPH